jgi:hypothetical protein
MKGRFPLPGQQRPQLCNVLFRGTAESAWMAGLDAEQTLTWQSIYAAFHPKRSVRGTRIDRQGLDSKDKYLRQPVKISVQRY